MDKRTCKVKRNISLLYLKSNKYQEALAELKEVEVSYLKLRSTLLIRFLGTWTDSVRWQIWQLGKDLQSHWHTLYHPEHAIGSQGVPSQSVVNLWIKRSPKDAQGSQTQVEADQSEQVERCSHCGSGNCRRKRVRFARRRNSWNGFTILITSNYGATTIAALNAGRCEEKEERSLWREEEEIPIKSTSRKN